MLSFICQSCKEAGELPDGNNEPFRLILKSTLHDKCKGGTHCDCQHRINSKNH